MPPSKLPIAVFPTAADSVSSWKYTNLKYSNALQPVCMKSNWKEILLSVQVIGELVTKMLLIYGMPNKNESIPFCT